VLGYRNSSITDEPSIPLGRYQRIGEAKVKARFVKVGIEQQIGADSACGAWAGRRLPILSAGQPGRAKRQNDCRRQTNQAPKNKRSMFSQHTSLPPILSTNSPAGHRADSTTIPQVCQQTPVSGSRGESRRSNVKVGHEIAQITPGWYNPASPCPKRPGRLACGRICCASKSQSLYRCRILCSVIAAGARVSRSRGNAADPGRRAFEKSRL